MRRRTADPPELTESESLLRHWKPRARGQGRGGQPEGAPETYLCPPSMDRRSAVKGVLILALSFRSIVKHSSLTAPSWTVSASLATWQKAMARWETGSSYSEGSSRLIRSS